MGAVGSGNTSIIIFICILTEGILDDIHRLLNAKKLGYANNLIHRQYLGILQADDKILGVLGRDGRITAIVILTFLNLVNKELVGKGSGVQGTEIGNGVPDKHPVKPFLSIGFLDTC